MPRFILVLQMEQFACAFIAPEGRRKKRKLAGTGRRDN
jgi:hypothetical protein